MAKVAVVTGGNRGIGYAIVKQLCREFDGVVIFTARDERGGTEVCTQLKEEGANVDFHQLELTSKESVAQFQNYLTKKFGGIDILINNAAILLKKAAMPYAERAEMTIKTNFFGTLNVCNSLFPLLQPYARVVNVTSTMGSLNNLGPDLQKKFASPNLTVAELAALMEKYLRDVKADKAAENGWPDDNVHSPAYRVSKIGLTVLSMAQARQIKRDTREGILVNAACPGWVRTSMGGPKAHKSPEQGAETPVYCALLPRNTSSPNGQVLQEKEVLQWIQVRLHAVAGFDGRKNDLVFCGSEAQQHVIFFPGDVQDYVENMERHKDNNKWKQWNLETTAKILEKRFPSSFIWVVRPARYHLNTFSCYHNFVEANLFGAPDHRNNDYGALNHLQTLLESAVRQLLDIDHDEEDATFDFPVVLVGFSKGCVVLNQIVHELANVTAGVDPGLRSFVSRISAMYWLDGGHTGESNTWITDEKYLYHLATHIPSIKVHVTPYQIQDSTRPWIGKEQSVFVEKLRSLGANVKVKVHFQAKDPSLAYHFKLIENF